MAITDIFPKIIVYFPLEENGSDRFDSHCGYFLKVHNGGTTPPGPYTDGRSAAKIGYGTEWYDQWTPTPAWIDGARGIALSGYGYLIDGSRIPFPYNRSFSLGFWMKPGTKLGDGSSIYSYADIICHWTTYASSGIFYRTTWENNGKISFSTCDNARATHTLTTAVSQNAYRGDWHYFTFTYNVNTGAKRILIDGAEKASGVGSTTLGSWGYYYGNLAGTFVIGGCFSSGSVVSKNPSNYDEVLLAYDYVLDDTDITWFMNGTTGRSYDDIPRNVAQYNKINSGTGTGYAVRLQVDNGNNSTGYGKLINVL